MHKLLTTICLPLLLVSSSCNHMIADRETGIYRERMVSFVDSISNYAKSRDSDFIVIPQNGIQLLAEPSSDTTLKPSETYLNAIEGIGRESVFYGYNGDDLATPTDARNYINRYLQLAQSHGKTVLVTDYASTQAKMKTSYAINDSLGYLSFAASKRELDVIPAYPSQPHEVNSQNITRLDQAENFLYLLNTQHYESKQQYIDQLAATNYDLLIIDLFFHGDISLTPEEIDRLRTKANGGRRLLIAYMSIGEAEDYRYYWERIWELRPPFWLGEENPNWEGNYLVHYWEPSWQNIIFGSDNAYLDRILAAGFDGVYLDLVDAYRRFEQDNQ